VSPIWWAGGTEGALRGERAAAAAARHVSPSGGIVRGIAAGRQGGSCEYKDSCVAVELAEARFCGHRRPVLPDMHDVTHRVATRHHIAVCAGNYKRSRTIATELEAQRPPGPARASVTGVAAERPR
jgi:hypothetical protein